jgi:hypothetical protein
MATRSAMPEHGSVVTEIIGEWFRVHVKSRSSNREHLVDLEEFDWNGQCDCEHFIYNCGPKLMIGVKPSAKLRCWHIRAARDWWFEKMAPRMKTALERK